MSNFTPGHGDSIDQERSHAFDGITEYDNNLPRWWLWTLYISVAVAIWYVFNFHFWTGVLSKADVDNWVAEKAAIREREIQTAPVLTEEKLREMSKDPALIAKGEAMIPKVMCMACHGPTLTGLIGPNLTDKYWLYGSNMKDLVESLANGRNNNQMPGRLVHKMTDEEIIAVACYVANLSRLGEKPGMRPQAPREKEAPINY
jgi:cytochrome c oxidase cbb3-type subunit III